MSEIKALTKATHKRVVTPNERQLELVRLMVDGLDSPDPRLPGKPKGEPLRLDEAAEIVGIRYRHARRIIAEPSMQAARAKALAERRGAAQPMALAALEAIVQAPVEPKASDVVAAAKVILGDDAKPSGVNVNVAVSNQLGVQFRPGYIIQLPAKEPDDTDA